MRSRQISAEVGPVIKLLRKSSLISIKTLAEKSGISHTHIYMIESGDRALSLDSLNAIATALDTTGSTIVRFAEHFRIREYTSREKLLHMLTVLEQNKGA